MSADEGFATIPRAIQRDPNISWRAKLVYLALSSRADKHMRCWPSIETIAVEASCSRGSVKNALKELRDLGLIDWTVGPAHGEGRPPNISQLGASKGHVVTTTPEKRSPRSQNSASNGQDVAETQPSKGHDVAETSEFWSPDDPSNGHVVTRNESHKNEVTTKDLLVADRAEHDSEPQRLDVERVCQHLADRIEANGCKRPTITKKWRQQARLLMDADKHTEAQVMKAIDWCQSDSFWRSNIMSMDKLRAQYDTLRLRALEQREKAKAATNGHQRDLGPVRAYVSPPKTDPNNLPWLQQESGR